MNEIAIARATTAAAPVGAAPITARVAPAQPPAAEGQAQRSPGPGGAV